MKISDIQIGTRHRRSHGDIDSLAHSLATIGLLHPVVVNSSNELIAGERRLLAAKQLGWKDIPATVVVTLDDIHAALRAERDENACRLDFTPSEAVAMAKALEPYEKKAAIDRQKATQGDRQTGAVKFTGPEKGRAADKIADAVGVSRPTLAKAAAVVEAAEKHPDAYGDIAEEMDRTGKVAPAYSKLAERAAEPKAPPVMLPHAPATNGKRFELTAEPEKLRPATAAEQFSKAIQLIYQRFDVVNKRGGIDACLEEWTKEDAQNYLRTLKDIRKRCDEQIPKIERKLKCRR